MTNSTSPDLVALLDNSEMLRSDELHKSGEVRFRGDRLIGATQKNLGTAYMEVREYRGYGDLGEDWRDRVLVRFAFVTRVWDETMKQLLHCLTDDHFPDVIVANSLFWDVTKYGHQAADKHKVDECWQFPRFEKNLDHFLNYVNELDQRRVSKSTAKPCLKIWRSTMPISHRANMTFIDKKADVVALVEDIAHANLRASKLVNDHLWDYLDAQYWFRQSHVDHRQSDGIHWNAKAHRWLTNVLLSHIGEAWGIGLPTFVSFENQRMAKMSNDAFYIIPGDNVETKVKRKDVSTKLT